MSLTNEHIAVLGHSGFVGQALLKKIPLAKGISLRDPSWGAQVMDAAIMINLVGKAHDHRGKASEQDYYDVNVEITKEIFQTFLGSPARLLVHISSLAALEEFESSGPLRESDQCNPISWYGKSKRAAEEWLLSQKLPISKKLLIIRPPMIHGPGDKGNLRLLYKLIAKGIPYPLSSFDNKRSFISIDNFTFFIEKMIEKEENLQSGLYHIADDEPISTKEIIKIIKDLTGKKTPDIALPKSFVKALAKIGDLLPIPLNSKRLKKMTGVLLISNEKIKRDLNIAKLPYSAHEGMERTIASFIDQPRKRVV